MSNKDRPAAEPQRKDVYTRVTDRIISDLEQAVAGAAAATDCPHIGQTSTSELI